MSETLLLEYLQRKVLVLDGAFGTLLQQHKFTETDFRGAIFANHPMPQIGNNDILVLTKSEIIYQIHCDYLNAGADIICTNTFNSNAISLSDYGLQDQVRVLNSKAVQLAKNAAHKFSTPSKRRFVAGSVGPTNKTASISASVDQPESRSITFQQLVQNYTEQVDSLMEAGVDIILLETIFDTLNAKAALFATVHCMQRQKKKLPIMVSGTITDNSGRTLSGQTVEAFAISLSHIPLLSIGFNCALGAEQLLPSIKNLAGFVTGATSCHPNAGLPNAFGSYDQSPEQMGQLIAPYLEQKLINIIGGCCGTTPDHIAEIAKIAAQFTAPRIRRYE